MPPRLKRAPPYEDDPGCKYIVINDPWPGNKVGKERNQFYWNCLCAWVRFMLDKKHEPECVFSVNTVCFFLEGRELEADLEFPFETCARQVAQRGHRQAPSRSGYRAHTRRPPMDQGVHSW